MDRHDPDFGAPTSGRDRVIRYISTSAMLQSRCRYYRSFLTRCRLQGLPFGAPFSLYFKLFQIHLLDHIKYLIHLNNNQIKLLTIPIKKL